jgi:DNA repair exonuclease SbcCD nuclease subunit
MSNLFKKSIICSDAHFGLKSNSDVHNTDCLDFIKWMTNLAKGHNCETLIFLGDYFNNRATINVKTLDVALTGLELLSSNFEKVIMILGNHDIFFRESRNINSVAWARNIPKIHVINDISEIGNCVLVPWLVGGEHKQLIKTQGKYMFGHFELPNFLMNAMVRMPDVGELTLENFNKVEQVFSGHFHKRQKQANVSFIGNWFPHNFADAGDNNRGIGILEWDKEIEYFSWPDAPKYIVHNISEIISEPEKYMLPRSYVRLKMDVDLSYEEATFIKETFVQNYNLREINLIPIKQDLQSDSVEIAMPFENIDTLVYKQISTINNEFYDSQILTSIYSNL